VNIMPLGVETGAVAMAVESGCNLVGVWHLEAMLRIGSC